MTRPYFPNGKSWLLNISREERLFCTHLYEALRKKDNRRKFIDKLKAASGKEKISKAALQKDNYEIGYEVCFYRDLAKAHDRADLTPKSGGFSPKRTFDLCLFGERYLVIVEAKAQACFDLKQLENLKEETLKFLKELGVEYQDLEIVIVCLGSSVLLRGEHSSRKQHTKKVKCKCDFIVTWKDLSKLESNDKEFSEIMKRADSCYKK